MKRVSMIAVAALVLAGASYPLFALDSHKKGETPATEQQNENPGHGTETQPNEIQAKDATATTPTPTETPAVVTEGSKKSPTAEAVAEKAKGAVQEGMTETGKKAATSAVPTSTVVDTVKNPNSVLPKN